MRNMTRGLARRSWHVPVGKQSLGTGPTLKISRANSLWKERTRSGTVERLWLDEGQSSGYEGRSSGCGHSACQPLCSLLATFAKLSDRQMTACNCDDSVKFQTHEIENKQKRNS